MSKRIMTIVSFEELQEKFNLVLNTIIEKKYLINLEIKEITTYLDYIPPGHSFMDSSTEPKSEGIFKLNVQAYYVNYRPLLKKAFNRISIYGEYEIVRNRERTMTQPMIDTEERVIEQAYEFVKYYKWLKTQNEEQTSKPQRKKSTLTHAQKILALSYLGIDMSKYFNNVQSAKILSSILDLDESNTKDYLTYFDGKKAKVKNKKNIEKMIELFEHQDFKPIQDKIKEDL